ncbi:FKBP-type peptidyl-prolyl cis-trans isomerase fkpA [Candidatus Photodesmus blepharus]|uniref:Peptidyl-prolyl cis-trans isomerase n=1 Tax=Candidatus Photodesmus blepharonis TaxID=1179155 RepID=A0A084CNQ5_9GAMM|nr:FKBP-type peptidyl-prolyl cis-trans isomerase [Candidatus Photodesmus blepharus]KEY91434.1 FKBP-type peptidyl-prolyl cis-trans isomerase fkpA [Candidatus Photodesmus blepharus]
MKSMFKVSLLTATVACAIGCLEEKMEPEVSSAEEVYLKTEDDRVAYAIGVSFADYLRMSIEKPAELGINLNKDIVFEGVKDVFSGVPKIDEEETQAALEQLDKRVAEAIRVHEEEKAAEIKKAGDAFRTKFEEEDSVIKTKTGLLYQVIREAEGERPKNTDTVQVHYKGTLIDGTQFDSSYDRGEPATLKLNRVIPGWTEGIQLMPIGSKFKFVIPPELAYGSQDTPAIPANSTLVFEVELLKVVGGTEIVDR